jgi:hypothetical protein
VPFDKRLAEQCEIVVAATLVRMLRGRINSKAQPTVRLLAVRFLNTAMYLWIV